MTYTINENPQFNSLEISFNEIPNKETREKLKAMRFRWHSIKKIWYGYSDIETLKSVLNGGDACVPVKTKNTKVCTESGVKVGDVFSMSWGYDQTNNNFFQVIEVLGKKAVKVVEIYLPYETTWTGPMAENRNFKINDGQMYEHKRNSIFIDDNENGDKKIISTKYGTPSMTFGRGGYTATPFKGGELYESWYA